MAIRKLEHYNVVTEDLAATVTFYTEALGMTAGPAPGLAADAGAWIYDETQTPVVHIVSVAPHHRDALPDFTRQNSLTALANAKAKTGVIDHIAFECDGYEAMLDRLSGHGIAAREVDLTHIDLRQIFANDPNGVTLELNFRTPRAGQRRADEAP